MSNRTPLTPLSESRINTINSPTKSLHQRHFKNNAQSNINSAKKQHNAFQGLQHLQFNERPSDQTRTSQFNEKLKDQTRSSQFNRADSDSSTTSFHRRRLLSTSRSSSVGLSSSPGIISSGVFANHQSLPSVIESNYSDKDHSCKSTSDFASPFAAHAQVTGKKPMKLPSLNIHLDTLPPLAHSISNTESFMDSLTVPLAATSTKQTETKTLLSKAAISAEDNQKECVNVHTEENLRAPKLANSKMVCDKLQTRLLLAYYKYKTQTKTVNHLIQKQKHVSNTTPTKKKSAALNRTNKTVTPGREKAARSLLKLYGSSYV